MGDHFASEEEGIEILHDLFSEGQSLVIEEKLTGQEFSLMSFCDGENLVHLPAVQDHKRAFENDKGPNTGGMGSYSMADGSLPFLTKEDIAAAKSINESVAQALREKTVQDFLQVVDRLTETSGLRFSPFERFRMAAKSRVKSRLRQAVYRFLA